MPQWARSTRPAGGAGTVFTATITPDGTGDVELNVAVGAADDTSSNPSAAAIPVTVTQTPGATVEETQRVIAEFMANRANNILNTQPELGSFITGANTAGGGPLGYLAIDGNRADQTFRFSTSLSRIRDSRRRAVAAMLDWAEETNASVSSNAEGVGWMVGPYIAGQVPGYDVIYQARVAYGTSDNRVTPIGTYADSFDGTRFLASGKITGSYALGRLTIDPSAAIAWFQETQHAYTDTNGLFIPEQTISLGEVRLGPSFSHELTLEDGMVLVPSLGVSAVYNFGISDSATSQGFALGDDALRARLDAGLLARSAFGTSLALSGFLDGLGIDNYRAFGGQARLTIPLN